MGSSLIIKMYAYGMNMLRCEGINPRCNSYVTYEDILHDLLKIKLGIKLEL